MSPQSGQIFLDGTNIHTMRTMELAKKVGYVPQMTKNFMGGTVLDAGARWAEDLTSNGKLQIMMLHWF